MALVKIRAHSWLKKNRVDTCKYVEPILCHSVSSVRDDNFDRRTQRIKVLQMLKLLKKSKKPHVFLIKEVSLQRGSYVHIVR